MTVNNLVAGPAAQVAEHSSIGSLVAHVSVVDADSGNSGVTSCFIDDSRQFALEQIEGLAQYKLTSNAQLDREQTSEYRVTVTCRDFGEPSLSAAQVVIIDVTDVNDHAPVCEEPFAVEVQENGGIGAYVTQVRASDADVGVNANLSFHLVYSSVTDYVRVDDVSGVVTSSTVLDFEDPRLSEHMLTLEVQVRDAGEQSQATTCHIVISVTDANDNSPVFAQPHFRFNVAEHSAVGALVGRIEASDPDSDLFNSFTLTPTSNADSSKFALDDNGDLFLADDLDREIQASYRFGVIATDANDVTLRSSADVIVQLDDVNDNAPVINFPSGSNRTISISNRVPVGFEVVQVRATDADSTSVLRFSMRADDDDDSDVISEWFALHPSSGAVTTRADLSDVSFRSVRVMVTVTDGDNNVTTRVTITVDSAVSHAQTQPSTERKPTNSGSGNLTIIVALSVATVVIGAILVVAIVLLRRRQPKKPASHYIHTTYEPREKRDPVRHRLYRIKPH